MLWYDLPETAQHLGQALLHYGLLTWVGYWKVFLKTMKVGGGFEVGFCLYRLRIIQPLVAMFWYKYPNDVAATFSF